MSGFQQAIIDGMVANMNPMNQVINSMAGQQLKVQEAQLSVTKRELVKGLVQDIRDLGDNPDVEIKAIFVAMLEDVRKL